MDELIYEKVDESNINIAIKIQNRIFPLEDGIDDLNESISKSDKYYDVLEYYLIHNGEYYVGITGIYSHKEYPNDAWVGWFGILPMFRKKHYGLKALEFTKDRAKELGFKALRLYTDDKYNFASIHLFEKFGMTSELYEAEAGKYYKIGNMLIFSLPLDGGELEPWNNRNIFLEDHEIKNNRLDLNYVEINKDNLNIAANIQYNLFYSCNNVGYLDYLKEVNTTINRLENRILPIDFLVYHGETPVGIIGLYEKKEYPDDVWITWFGVVPQYRNHGIGTQMLLKIIETAKYYKKKNLRLNTYETWNYKAQNIYNRTMQLSEDYNNSNEEHFLIKYGKPKIFSISLVDVDVLPWNNKFLNLTEELDLNEESIRKLKEDNILEIFSESTFMDVLTVKKEKKLKYIKIDNNNINDAVKVQMKIFPDECAYIHYKNTIEKNEDYQNYYLVYDGNEIIGITGLYSFEDINVTNSLWLGWFGVLEDKRKRGYGKRILLDTIEMAKDLSKEYPIKYFRLYTSTRDNDIAQILYKEVMDTCENYNNENDFNYDNTCVIYSKSICNEPVTLWNNKFLDLKTIVKQEEESLKYINNMNE